MTLALTGSYHGETGSKKAAYLQAGRNTKSPYDGDTAYWSERNSKLYDGETSIALKKQNHKCASCGLKFIDEERIHLHHIDGNHANWKKNNLEAIHESCHDYKHMSKSASQEHRKLGAMKVARPDLTQRCGR